MSLILLHDQKMSNIFLLFEPELLHARFDNKLECVVILYKNNTSCYEKHAYNY